MIRSMVTEQQILKGEDLQQFWREYFADPSADRRHRLMVQYAGLVRYVLNNINLPPNPILSDEDYIQIGMLGLFEALERYDMDRGVKFETFAIPRIRGMILDEVRRNDKLSRTARRRSQDYLHTADKLRSEKGREVSSEEIRRKMDLTNDEYKAVLQAAAAATSTMSLNDIGKKKIEDDEDSYSVLETVADTSAENPLDSITEAEQVDFISDYLTKLKERQRLIMTLYYYKGLTFKEIGQLLKITESRVCQIHTSIIKDLRDKVQED